MVLYCILFCSAIKNNITLKKKEKFRIKKKKMVFLFQEIVKANILKEGCLAEITSSLSAVENKH